MKDEHARELEQFDIIFSDKELENFHLQRKIFELFLQTENHISLNDLNLLVREKIENTPVGLIEETVSLLIKYGFAEEKTFNGGASLFEHRHPGEHHDHLVCTQCKKIIEFENDDLEKLQKMIAGNYKFEMLRHRMEIYGLCTDCNSQKEQETVLSQVRPGQRLQIIGIDGGRKVKMRLRTMGLSIGDSIEVVNTFGGQVVIAVDFTRLVLGQGMAEKIRVMHE